MNARKNSSDNDRPREYSLERNTTLRSRQRGRSNAIRINKRTLDKAATIEELDVNYNYDFYQTVCTGVLKIDIDKRTFLKLVDLKKKKLTINVKAAELEVTLDQIVLKFDSSKEKALLAVLSQPLSHDKTVVLVTKLLTRGASTGFTDDQNRSALHYAVRKGFLDIAQKLLEYGGDPLQNDLSGMSPFAIAMKNYNDYLANTLLSYVHKQNILFYFCRVREMFTRHSSEPPLYSLHQLIERDMLDTALIVLDSLIEPNESSLYNDSIISYALMEADRDGFTPDKPNFSKSDPSCLQLIAKAGNPDLICHPVVALLTKRKWEAFARTRFTINAGVYICVLIMLTISVTLVTEADHPEMYSKHKPEDVIRAICEIITVCVTLYIFLQEIVEFVSLRAAYFLDPMNILDVGAPLLLLTVIPLRFAGSDAQWGVYSAAYMLSVIRILKYAPIFRRLTTYTSTFLALTTSSFFEFVVMFLVLALTFTGGFTLALRLDGTLSSQEYTTSSFGHVFFSAVRVLVQVESTLDYVANENQNGRIYSWYGTILYMTYLFIVLVMLLNILIAQLSDIYNSSHTDVQNQVDINRAWIVARVEVDLFHSFIFRKDRYRVKYYVDSEKVSAEEMSKYLTRSFSSTKEYPQHVANVDEQLEDLDINMRSVINSLRQHDEVLEEILKYIKTHRGRIEEEDDTFLNQSKQTTL